MEVVNLMKPRSPVNEDMIMKEHVILKEECAIDDEGSTIQLNPNSSLCSSDSSGEGTYDLYPENVNKSGSSRVHSLEPHLINASGNITLSDILTFPQHVGIDEIGCINSITSENTLIETEESKEPEDRIKCLEKEETCATPDDSFLILHIDIEEPLFKLREAVEQRLDQNFEDYGVWLLGSQKLDDKKNLVEQGVVGEGLVQMHVELKVENNFKKINILDVLKPAEEFVDVEDDSNAITESSSPVAEVLGEREQDVVRWIVDTEFKKNRTELNIPDDPTEWTTIHVSYWLQWALKKFGLFGIQPSQWNITGEELCNMSLSEFRSKVPLDPGDLFWTHLELLRKCKLVAVIQPKSENACRAPEISSKSKPVSNIQHDRPRILSKSRVVLHKADEDYYIPSPHRSGNNGQVQLWQFLLELLTDWQYTKIIQWYGTEGEFRLINPDEVARLWGEKKHKPAMNYEKLSRALRYYYEGDMISKVYAKRFVYKFVCNLKDILGYDARELMMQVKECAALNGEEYNSDEMVS